MLRRDRIPILFAIAGVVAIAWIYIVLESRAMTGTSMAGTAELVLRFLMWAAMMTGMMLPTAIPMTLMYAAAARKARSDSTPLPPMLVFVAGYVVVWVAFSVAATAAHWALDRASLLSPMMQANKAVLSGAILLAAGVYQLTPVKDRCLENCRAPAHFMSRHWRGGSAGAVRLGARYGVYCLGCCWVLMALLFVGGAMNLVWVAAIALFVLIEKTARFGRALGRFAGVGLAVAGVAAVAGLITVG